MKKPYGPNDTVHVLKCNDQTSTDGFWDNSCKAVLHVKSGDIVEIETGIHLGMKPETNLDEWTDSFKKVIAENPNVHTFADAETGTEKLRKGAGHHRLTGPVHVEGAEPGDVLEIEILHIEPYPYGFNLNPRTAFLNLGFLPEDFPDGSMRWYTLDQKSGTYEFMDGVTIKARPFPGSIGVELGEQGRWSNIPPGKHGGNMDNKELVTGTVLYLPVHTPGAGLKTGDSHLAQGNGEVNLNALEGAFKCLSLRLSVRKDLGSIVNWPMASTPDNWVIMGFHTNLEQATKMAVRKSIDFLHLYYGMPRSEAYAFCSQAVDFNITQLVDYAKGVHGLIPKRCFTGDRFTDKNGLLLTP
ncbi:MAG: acetamidase/formamidase family protein [Pseudodesulfovibrio sp.]|nr:acetamidase/formamidase family protein [Pseudodesulfovibrio sp.]